MRVACAVVALLLAGCFQDSAPPPQVEESSVPEPWESIVTVPAIGDRSTASYGRLGEHPYNPWRVDITLAPARFLDAWGIVHKGVILNETSHFSSEAVPQRTSYGMDRCGVVHWVAPWYAEGGNAMFETGTGETLLDSKPFPFLFLGGQAIRSEAPSRGSVPEGGLLLPMGSWSLKALALDNDTVRTAWAQGNVADPSSFVHNPWELNYDGSAFPHDIAGNGGYLRIEAASSGEPFAACGAPPPTSPWAPEDFTILGKDGPHEELPLEPDLATVMRGLRDGTASPEAKMWLDSHPDYFIATSEWWRRAGPDSDEVGWRLYVDDYTEGDRMVASCPPDFATSIPHPLLVCQFSGFDGFWSGIIHGPPPGDIPILRHAQTLDLLEVFLGSPPCGFEYGGDWGLAFPCDSPDPVPVNLRAGAIGFADPYP